jgi:hypothetical protein
MSPALCGGGESQVVATRGEQPAGPERLVCARCAAALRPGDGNFYWITVEAVADPTPPTISAEDLATDVRAQIEALLARLEGLSEEEAMSQVYRRLTFHLCGPCYRRWIEDPTG